ncbi:MAG: S-layer homology domain-containing protein [Candidatus Margulisiibacteriota bacterium]
MFNKSFNLCLAALFLFLSLAAAGQAAPLSPSSPTPEAAKKIVFKDLKPKDRGYDYVMKMVNDFKIIAGYPDGTFKAKKTVTRGEFVKIVSGAIDYLEKKYQVSLAANSQVESISFKDLKNTHWAYPYAAKTITKYQLFSGYPDGTFKPGKTINRFEMALVLGKTIRMIYGRCELPLPLSSSEASLKDVKKNHWAMKDIQLLLQNKIMYVNLANKLAYFKGNVGVSRLDLAISGAKTITLADSAMANISPEVLARLRNETRASAISPDKELVARSVAMPARPQAFLSGGWGGVYEKGSGTNNWRGGFISGTWASTYNVANLSGNYELTGKYGYNQVVYIVPGSGSTVSAVINNENRYELELNTTYPIIDLFGVKGKLLLGGKYFNLANQSAPCSFAGFNAGVVTSARVWERELLIRAFYSLPLVRVQVTPSVLGQPVQLFDYEASINANLFGWPMLLGLTGETMILSGGDNRYYNMIFARYFIM